MRAKQFLLVAFLFLSALTPVQGQKLPTGDPRNAAFSEYIQKTIRLNPEVKDFMSMRIGESYKLPDSSTDVLRAGDARGIWGREFSKWYGVTYGEFLEGRALPTGGTQPRVDTVRLAPPIQKAGFPWGWLIAFVATAALVLALVRANTKNRETTAATATKDAEHNRAIASIREIHLQQMDALRAENAAALAGQQQLDFVLRRSLMADLPEGVADAVTAGPPVRHEGVTAENREDVFSHELRSTYQRLHPGASTDGLVFQYLNARRVLISSLPGETYEMAYGDDTRREVTLVREPGWEFDGRVLRGTEVIADFPGICVVGFCANRFAGTRSYLIGAHTEPYQIAAVHVPLDWNAVAAARRASQRVTLHSNDGRVVARRGDDVILDADYAVLEVDGVRPHDDGFAFGNARLMRGVTEPAA